MAKKRRSRTPKRKGRAKSSTSATASVKCAPDAASRRFVRDLVVRGEAREPDAEGKLAPEATHAIVRGRGDTAEVRRARFKMF